MNKRELSLVLMIINMIIVWTLMSFVYTHIILRFIIGIMIFFSLYRIEYYLIARGIGNPFSKSGRTIRQTDEERMRKHYETIKEIRENE